MAEASLAPPFGLTGARRVFAIAAAAILLTGFFVVVGFPYDRIAPRVESAIRASTGLPVKIGRVGLGFGWLAPELRAWDVEAPLPSGKHLVLKRLRVRPAWSLSWFRGAPAVVVALRAPLGEIDGTVTLGREYGFSGELRQVQLGELPLDGVAPGAALDGLASGEIDLHFTQERATGSVHLTAEKGSLTLPLLPIGVPFDTLKTGVVLGGDQLATIEQLDLQGPLVSLTASGTIGQAAEAAAAPLALRAKVAVRDPSMRSMIASQGVGLDANGESELEIGGTLGAPLPQAAGARRMPR
jgi:type II secretion system protein N